MKKFFAIVLSVLCFIFTLALVACNGDGGGGDSGSPETPPASEPPEVSEDPEVPDTDGSGVLIAYFSWSETTTRLAEHVKAQIPTADLYRIERETPYSSDYNEVAYGEAKDEADSNARPPVKDLPSAEQMSAYDAIVIMYPIWWHTAPMVVGTFLETYDLNGVDIYPITQSASMSVSQFDESFAFVAACAGKNGAAVVHDGLGTKSTAAIDDYLKQNGIID